VADAYDAMTSDRPYRKKLPVKVAVAELQSFAGTQFDALVVETFCNNIHQWSNEATERDPLTSFI
jgi:HD-GYP domain-containing protein (c-di-GMP phosphodiesterase class II)